MKPAAASWPTSERGFVLPGVVMFVIVLTILGLSLFTLSSYEAQFMNSTLDETQAFYLANGAMDRARYLLASTHLLQSVSTNLGVGVDYDRDQDPYGAQITIGDWTLNTAIHRLPSSSVSSRRRTDTGEARGLVRSQFGDAVRQPVQHVESDPRAPRRGGPDRRDQQRILRWARWKALADVQGGESPGRHGPLRLEGRHLRLLQQPFGLFDAAGGPQSEHHDGRHHGALSSGADLSVQLSCRD
jgi:hypothetical protein